MQYLLTSDSEFINLPRLTKTIVKIHRKIKNRTTEQIKVLINCLIRLNNDVILNNITSQELKHLQLTK